MERPRTCLHGRQSGKLLTKASRHWPSHLKERTQTLTKRDLLPTGSFSRQHPGLGKAKVSSLPSGWQGPRSLSHHLLALWHNSQEAGTESGARTKTRTLQCHPAQHLIHCAKHLPLLPFKSVPSLASFEMCHTLTLNELNYLVLAAFSKFVTRQWNKQVQVC